jgi:hypothetical protein
MSQHDFESPAEGASAPSLFGALLCGLIRGPALRDELGKLSQGPATFELADDVDEVLVRIDAECCAASPMSCVSSVRCTLDGTGRV